MPGASSNSDTYKVSGGLHGVGVSVVNALSDWLELEIQRDGAVWEQSYEKGKPTSKLKQNGKTRKTGTRVTFHADPSIFEKTVYSYDTLATRLREHARRSSRRVFSTGKWVHQPRKRDAHHNKHCERPRCVLEPFERLTAAKSPECERNNQRKKQKTLEVRQLQRQQNGHALRLRAAS